MVNITSIIAATTRLKFMRGSRGGHVSRLQYEDEPSSSLRKCIKRIDIISPYIKERSVGAELGVFKGYFLEHLLSTNPKKLYAVDPWYLDEPNWYWAVGDPSTLSALIKILSVFEEEINTGTLIPIVDFSQNFLRSMPDQSFDWVYIDTVHSYDQSKLEIEICLTKVKKNGYIFGDDYTSDKSHKHHGVWKAVNEFRKDNKIELIVDGIGRQFVAQIV